MCVYIHIHIYIYLYIWIYICLSVCLPGGGHGKPLQYSCLENPVDRGVW